ncbi:anti-sigma factor antagonist [Hoyosella rhizosphaerae]|uniref:STAS domain-containing protein n=1 Tax=Hoyosella rhizosphaerae TaxID=1755582 RepID=A0A916U8F4_9ACTN|nr:anti-sigma factor antagonist [Hoyosella rhizosphaerae]MBN4927550.1 anti-sigma factor antagonist [Hoyosella rhizosphaerae]GGC63587.1 hypothetical protein GCM10011410_15050 [Hoyosella rhizosphaerae]
MNTHPYFDTHVTISIEQLDDDTQLVRVGGELDAMALPRLFRVLGALPQPEKVVIDIRKALFVSRTALRALTDLNALTSLEDATLVIVAPHSVANVYDTVDEAHETIMCTTLRDAWLLLDEASRAHLRLVKAGATHAAC